MRQPFGGEQQLFQFGRVRRESRFGRVAGVDLNGNRQPRAKLTLEGAPLKNPLTENADDKGEFLFKEVPPGVYKLSAVPEFGGAKGHITVTVKPGEAKTGQTVSVSR